MNGYKGLSGKSHIDVRAACVWAVGRRGTVDGKGHPLGNPTSNTSNFPLPTSEGARAVYISIYIYIYLRASARAARPDAQPGRPVVQLINRTPVD